MNLSVAIVGAFVLAVLNPAVGAAQAADYLKGANPWQKSTAGISGLWDMQNYISSSTNPPRKRVARTIDGQIPPMLPWAAVLLEKRLVDAEHDKAFPNTASLCLPQGVPYMLHAAVGGPLQILETPGQVTIISDAYNEMWFVYLNRKHPPREDLEPTYHGDSVGHWEGDTLVVDTIGLNTKTTLDQVGMPHSEDLRVVTRIRRTDATTLEFVVTVDDPKTFSKPWSRRQFYKKAAADARIMEVVCENQRNGVDSEGYQSLDFRHDPLENDLSVFAGRWQMNAAKTKMGRFGPNGKNLVRSPTFTWVFTPDGPGLRMDVFSEYPQPAPTRTMTMIADARQYPCQGPAPCLTTGGNPTDQSYAYYQIEPRMVARLFYDKGQVVEYSTYAVSQDGKSFTSISWSPETPEYQNIQVFDKQQ